MFTNEQIISLTDLTSLTGNETDAEIIQLCQLANNQPVSPAAICIYKEYLTTAKQQLQDKSINLATVVNFPAGTQALEETLAEIKQAIAAGADEIDLVAPYHLLQNKQYDEFLDYLKACRNSCQQHCLKVIIESGELSAAEINLASELCIKANANFIKTSTGKTATGATLEAAKIILTVIKQTGTNTGIKLSGGIRTKEQAMEYLALTEKLFGVDWITASHFRFGCSRLPTSE